MRDSETTHTLMDGKLHAFRRPRSSKWQCSTYLAGREHRASTKTDSLIEAKVVARDWYLALHGKLVRGELKAEKTFKDAAAVFEREYEIITEGQRHPRYVSSQSARLTNHVTPFFGAMALSAITSGAIQEYRVHRAAGRKDLKTEKIVKPSRSTLHQEIVALRQVLKTAVRLGWLAHVPDLSAPYKASGKISHRGWFSPEEYRQIYRATRARALKYQDKPRGLAAARVHDYVLFMANTGLRPDEAARIDILTANHERRREYFEHATEPASAG